MVHCCRTCILVLSEHLLLQSSRPMMESMSCTTSAKNIVDKNNALIVLLNIREVNNESSRSA